MLFFKIHPRSGGSRYRVIGFLLGLGLRTLAQSTGSLVVYPTPAGLAPAPDFQVWINGRELFLYDTKPAAIGSFSFSGEVTVELTGKQDIKWVDVRPKSRGIVPTLRDNRVTFKLNKPGQFSIEFHNESKRVIHLFANPPEADIPRPDAPGVRYFQGGRVYDVGLIDLKDGEHLYLEGGAVLKGSVQATSAQNIRISGRGILDGDSLPRGTRIVLLDRVEGARVEGVTLVNSYTWTLEPMFCRNLRIDNLKIVNWDFGSDGIDLVGCNDVRITNSFVRANDDCIVLKTWKGTEKYPRSPEVGSDISDVAVSNCVFWNMPWGNALEIGFELRANAVRDVRFTDCDIIHVERGAAMSIHNGDYATVENILFENIRVEDARHKLIDLAVFYSQYSTDHPADPAERRRRYKAGAWDGVLWVYPGEEAKYAAKRGKIRNVTFRNIAVVDGPVPFSILSGYDAQHGVENVRIENLTILGRRVRSLAEGKFFVENAKGVVLK